MKFLQRIVNESKKNAFVSRHLDENYIESNNEKFQKVMFRACPMIDLIRGFVSAWDNTKGSLKNKMIRQNC